MKRYISVILTVVFSFNIFQGAVLASQELSKNVVSESSLKAIKKPAVYTDNYLTYEQRIEDLNVVYNTLVEQNHFNSNTTREQLDEMRNKIINKINDISDIQFGYELRKLAASKHDAHTKIYGVPSKQTRYLLPIWDILRLHDGFYVMTTYPEYKEYLKNKIVAINGHSIDEVIEQLKPYLSYENDIRLETEAIQLLQCADLLKYVGIIDNLYTVNVTFEDSEGKKWIVNMNTISSDEYDKDSLVYNEIIRPKTYINTEKIYDFFQLNEDTLFIQYNMCTEDEGFTSEDFRKKLEQDINKKNYSKVIFDLRYNTGGQYGLFDGVINTLGELKSKKKFELYTLIGNETFSAGVMNAIDLKYKCDATLVGTPTGGNVNFYADNMYFQLPNSKLNFIYSTNFVESKKDYDKQNLYPDIEVKHTLDGYINGIDEDIEKILKN